MPCDYSTGDTGTMSEGGTPSVFTIGYSNHSLDRFMALLARHESRPRWTSVASLVPESIRTSWRNMTKAFSLEDRISRNVTESWILLVDAGCA
jgi:hypothetical protein